MPHFTVAICTAKRPAMLATALESIVNLAVPDHGTLSVVVVENDLKPSSLDVIEKIRATTAVPIKHCLEPRIGIPYACNRSLEAALAENADWIAMLDDDETAPPNWLSLLFDRAHHSMPMSRQGPYRQVPDIAPPHWWKPLSGLGKPTGFLRRDAYTNNVMFHSKLIASVALVSVSTTG